MLTCEVCGTEFKRPGSRGPIPKRCSQRCITKAGRTPKRIEYEREYRRKERAFGNRKAYEFEYNRRPEVRARNAKRMRIKWHTDPEYRAKQLARWGVEYPDVVVAAPYTGHRWLEMAAKVVGTNFDPTAPWADDRYDDMGEALLALLEGRDMNEAVKLNRSKEYVNRHLNIHMGDWRGDEDEQQRWFDNSLPAQPSAEDVVVANESVQYYVETRFKDVHTRSRTLRHKTQQPSRRRMKDAGWRKHERRIKHG